MNVYKINEYYIAAQNPEFAFSQFMEETDGLENTFFGDLQEGEEEQVVITIKRLSTKAIQVKSVPCCKDGCDKCEGLNDNFYYSYQELIDKKEDFPSVLAKEE